MQFRGFAIALSIGLMATACIPLDEQATDGPNTTDNANARTLSGVIGSSKSSKSATQTNSETRMYTAVAQSAEAMNIYSATTDSTGVPSFGKGDDAAGSTTDNPRQMCDHDQNGLIDVFDADGDARRIYRRICPLNCSALIVLSFK